MKNKTKKRRVSKVIEQIKTVLMALLLVSLIALVAIYVGGMNLGAMGGAADIGESFDRLWSVQSEQVPTGLDTTRLVPEFIGFRQAASAGPRAAFADINALSKLYEITAPCILELFGSASVCRALPQADGAEMFEAACMGEEYVYIRYHVPVLYQIIYAYAADRLTVFEGDVAVGEGGAVGAYISELVIVADKDFAAHRFVAYAHDGEGRYYLFYPGSNVVSSDFYISKLADGVQNITTVDFYFASDDNFPTPVPIVSEEIRSFQLVSEDAALGEDARNALLSLFGYNLDKLSSYSDENGYLYVDTHGQLRLRDGYVSFIADETPGTSTSPRGVRIDSLLGYTSSAASGLFDKITAVDNLIRKLGEISTTLIGSEGRLCLGDVYTQNGLLVVEYFLTFNGVRVDTEPYFRAVLTDQTVSEAAVSVKKFTPGENTELIPSAKYVLGAHFEIGEISAQARISRVNLCYTDGSVKWNVIFDK